LKKEVTLILSPAEAYREEAYLPVVAGLIGVSTSDINLARIVRKSIDARGRNIKVNMSFEVYIGEEPPSPVENTFLYQPVENKPEIVVIGAGPAGLGAASVLAQRGYKVTVYEQQNRAGGATRMGP